jgi:uncharacterized membrane protein
MRLRLPLTISALVIAVMAAISAWGWMMLPHGARIASHWGFDGQVNGTLPKAAGLLLLPAIGLAICALLAVIPVIEPRRENLIASRKAFLAIWLGALAAIAVAHAVMVANALGYAVDVPSVLIVAVAGVIAVAGNYLGKVRSNFFVGIRTPWTLSSDLAWEKSHRVLGRLFVFSALITLAVRFAVTVEAGYIALAATLTSSALIGVASSYVYWKQDPDRLKASS